MVTGEEVDNLEMDQSSRLLLIIRFQFWWNTRGVLIRSMMRTMWLRVTHFLHLHMEGFEATDTNED